MYQITPAPNQFEIHDFSGARILVTALGVKFPGPFLNRKPPALTSINRRRSATNPEIALLTSVNALYSAIVLLLLLLLLLFMFLLFLLLLFGFVVWFCCLVLLFGFVV